MGWIAKVTYMACGHVAYLSYVRCVNCPPGKPPGSCPIWQVLPVDSPGICATNCPGPNAPYIFSSQFACSRDGPNNFNRPFLIGDLHFNLRGEVVKNPEAKDGKDPRSHNYTITSGEFDTAIFQDPNGDVTVVTDTASSKNAVLRATPDQTRIFPKTNKPQVAVGSLFSGQLDPNRNKAKGHMTSFEPASRQEDKNLANDEILPTVEAGTPKITVTANHPRPQVAIGSLYSRPDGDSHSEKKKRGRGAYYCARKARREREAMAVIQESIEEDNLDHRRPSNSLAFETFIL